MKAIKGVLVEDMDGFGHAGDYVHVACDDHVYLVTNNRDVTIDLTQNGLDNLVDCEFNTVQDDWEGWEDDDDWSDPDNYDDYDYSFDR